jgi:hypothetical protein
MARYFLILKESDVRRLTYSRTSSLTGESPVSTLQGRGGKKLTSCHDFVNLNHLYGEVEQRG